MPSCPICLRPNVGTFPSGSFAGAAYECQTCGRYKIGIRLLASINNIAEEDPRRRAALSAYIRATSAQGEIAQLRMENWESAAAAHMHTPVATKLRRLLEHIANKSTRPGDRVEVNAHDDYPLFDAAEAGEVSFLLNTLCDRHEIVQASGPRWTVTALGWERLDPVGGGGAPGACFVAMSFKEDLAPAFDDAIAPAVRKCGFSDIRVDRKQHVDNINYRIMADIRSAQFVVADFTYHSAGVYFEAGFALGLGKTVIWTCRADEFKDKVHFDTRPYNHILWTSEADLLEKLTTRIQALIPNAKMT